MIDNVKSESDSDEIRGCNLLNATRRSILGDARGSGAAVEAIQTIIEAH